MSHAAVKSPEGGDAVAMPRAKPKLRACAEVHLLFHDFVACPSCSRQNFDVISTVNELERRVEDITTPLDVAIIGCIVNGPGEAKEADIGLTGATPNNLIYRDGAPSQKVTNEHLIDDHEAMIRRRVAEKIAAEAAENVELTSN